MKNLDVLTEEEEFILNTIKEAGDTLPEHELHLIIQIATSISGKGKELYQFNETAWTSIDEKYETGIGATLYSQRLHKVIESLVEKKYLARNPNKPIILHIYNNKQMTFDF